uniref:DUF4139 domain-containing protein n=1 Tax=Moniliophthora roreri TaxID=221103 RepID=A0A0W0G4G4_MONRR
MQKVYCIVGEFLGNYYDASAGELDEKLLGLEQRLKDVEKEIQEERKKIAPKAPYERGRHASIGVVAEEDSDVELVLIYAVAGATWKAGYDIRVDTTRSEKSVTLIYKAIVSQSTSEARHTWENVPLTLETASPTYGVNLPSLDPWNISVYKPAPPPPSVEIKAAASNQDVQSPETLLGFTLRGTASYTPHSETPAMGHATSYISSKGSVSATFRVPGLVSIPSDGGERSFTIVELELSALMTWFSIPKVDTRVHLKAQIHNESEYTLLPGKASVYVDGSFISKSDVPAVSPLEKFDCALGLDPSVRITYHPQSKKSSTSGFYQKSASYVYIQRLTIHNTKVNRIPLLKIVDQIPVSEDAQITVKLVNPALKVPTGSSKQQFTAGSSSGGETTATTNGDTKSAGGKRLSILSLSAGSTVKAPERTATLASISEVVASSAGPNVKVAEGVVAQWDGADDSSVDVDALGKNGKINWLCEVAGQEKFVYVKRGNLITLEELSSVDMREWEDGEDGESPRHEISARKRVYKVKLHGVQSEFTAVIYEGEDASTPAVTLLPVLEQPLGHGQVKESGAVAYVIPDVVEPITVPPTADMLSEETAFKYFLNNHGPRMDSFILGLAEFLQYRSDTRIHICNGQILEICTVFGRRFHETLPGLASLCRNAHPVDIMGRLRFDTIYQDPLQEVAHRPRGSGSWGWRCWLNGCPMPQTVLEGGLTRFDLDTTLNEGQSIHVEAQFESNMSLVWLAQAPRVTDNEEHCYMVRPPVLVLKSGKISYEEEAVINDTNQPLYLFVYRPPSTISELIEWRDGYHTHYWSFDEAGQSKLQNLPAKEHPQHELPYLKVVSDGFDDISLYSWPMYLYEAIRNWQVARGFDPTTANFARHMNYPELEVIGAGRGEEQLEEIVEAPAPFHELGLETLIPVNERGRAQFPVIGDPENESPKKLRVIYGDFMKVIWYQAGYTGPVRYDSIEKSPTDYYDMALLPTHLKIQDPVTKGGWILDLVAHFTTNFSACSKRVFALRPAGMHDNIVGPGKISPLSPCSDSDTEGVEGLKEAVEDERGQDGVATGHAVKAPWMSANPTSSHQTTRAAITEFWQQKWSRKRKKRMACTCLSEGVE